VRPGARATETAREWERSKALLPGAASRGSPSLRASAGADDVDVGAEGPGESIHAPACAEGYTRQGAAGKLLALETPLQVILPTKYLDVLSLCAAGPRRDDPSSVALVDDGPLPGKASRHGRGCTRRRSHVFRSNRRRRVSPDRGAPSFRLSKRLHWELP